MFLTPSDRLEYAASNRAKCKICKVALAQGELRLQRHNSMQSWSIHMCCVPQMQQNKRSINDITKVPGFAQLTPEHQDVVRRMWAGELRGQHQLRGFFLSPARIRELAEGADAPGAGQPTGKAAKATRAAKPTAGKKKAK